MSNKPKVETKLGFFEKYLTVWVLACMAGGTILGYAAPGVAYGLNSLQIAHVSIPIAVLLFFMMYPIMVRIDFRQVVMAGKTTRPLVLTLIVNWAIKPFTMVLIATLFFRNILAPFIPPDQATGYLAGAILLGIAPCTAMVLVWSYLADGFMGHTLIMVAVNSLTMLALYAPLGRLLLGLAAIPIPFATIALSILFYVGLPLIAGYFTRTTLIKKRGLDWYNTVFLRHTGRISIVALLTTLIVLFALQGEIIVNMPVMIVLIAIPLLIQTLLIFTITYVAARFLRITYEDAAPSAMIGASNHFEVAIAVATTLFGLGSPAALATVVGVLIEVPVMLFLVRVCLKTRGLFPKKQVS